jgi:hypothetical protein
MLIIIKKEIMLDVSSSSPNLLSDRVHGHTYCVRTQALPLGTKCPPMEPLSLIAILPTKSTRIYRKAGCWNISGNKELVGSVPSVPQRKTHPKAQNSPVRRIHSPPVVERKRNIAITQEVNRHRNVLSQLPAR